MWRSSTSHASWEAILTDVAEFHREWNTKTIQDKAPLSYRNIPQTKGPRILCQEDVSSDENVHTRWFFQVIEHLPEICFPTNVNPFDNQWGRVLHPTLQGQTLEKHESAPEWAPRNWIRTMSTKFGIKGFVCPIPKKFQKCHYCQAQHLTSLCDIRPPREISQLSALSIQFFRFLEWIPRVTWKPFSGLRKEAILNLPKIWRKIKRYRRRFWNQWYQFSGTTIRPFSSQVDWSFPSRTKVSIETWYALGTHSSMLQHLFVGDEYRFWETPPRLAFRNSPTIRQHLEFVCRKVEEMLSKGMAVRIPPEHAQMVLPCKVVDNGRKLRLVVNGIPLNFYLPLLGFKLSRPQDIAQFINPGDKLLTGDLKSAFYTTAYTPNASLFTVFSLPNPRNPQENGYLAPVSQMFAVRLSPHRFCRRYILVSHFLSRVCGLSSVFYVDDFRIIVPNEPWLLGLVGHFVQQLHSALGLQLQFDDDKSMLRQGRTKDSFLGYGIDTETQQFFVTSRRRRKFAG